MQEGLSKQQTNQLFEQAGALNAFMLFADTKPILYEAEKESLRSVLSSLNTGIGELSSGQEQDQQVRVKESEELVERLSKMWIKDE